jgi:hypothetical protein
MSPLMPALLNRMSSLPNRAAACASAAATCSSTATSVTLKSATPGPSSATAASSRPRASPARCTLAAPATNNRAQARPIPLSPPVIRAALLSSRAMTAPPTP